MVRLGWWLAAALAVGLQLYGLYRPSGPPSDLSLPGLDKVAHMIIFALPVLLVLLGLRRAEALRPGQRAKARFWIVPVMFAAHAVISELIQGRFYRHRTGDALDVLADLLGIAVGYGAFMVIQRRAQRTVTAVPDGEPHRTNTR